MKKYQQLAQQITEQIGLGVWLPGDRLPSLREQVVSSGMSFMTVSHAYQLLESQGRIIARPQSGYYVAPQPIKQRQPEPPAQVTRDESVDINTYTDERVQVSNDTDRVVNVTFAHFFVSSDAVNAFFQQVVASVGKCGRWRWL